jgi:hypothetical protein
MFSPEIVFPPYGHKIKCEEGMKSGWVMTALDNTLIHIAVMLMIKHDN